jgi:hypothetical protein
MIIIIRRSKANLCEQMPAPRITSRPSSNRRADQRGRGDDTALRKIHRRVWSVVAMCQPSAVSASEDDATGVVATATFTERSALHHRPRLRLPRLIGKTARRCRQAPWQRSPRPWHSLCPVASTACARRGRARPYSAGFGTRVSSVVAAYQAAALQQKADAATIIFAVATFTEGLLRSSAPPCISRLVASAQMFAVHLLATRGNLAGHASESKLGGFNAWFAVSTAYQTQLKLLSDSQRVGFKAL